MFRSYIYISLFARFLLASLINRFYKFNYSVFDKIKHAGKQKRKTKDLCETAVLP